MEAADILDRLEEKDDRAILPDAIELEAYRELTHIDREVVEEAVDTAADYWRKEVEERGRIQQQGPQVAINYSDELSRRYQKELVRDLDQSYELDAEELSEIASTLSKLPEDRDTANTPYERDPKRTPEDEDFPSMFQ
jgi:hypothetical protein